MDIPSTYLANVKKEFLRYKTLAEKAFEQLNEEDIHHTYDEWDNSIAVIVKHIAGNMRSRWTNFLTEDGEKSWRNRETEFEASIKSKTEMLGAWNAGWECLFTALDGLTPENLSDTVEIRKESHTVIEAINRQLGHYVYHIGQIVFLTKSIMGKEWQSPTIPRGQSDDYNKQMFKKAAQAKKGDKI
ncbi:MAG: DUF1572 domain-containing protein [Eudoraea sp.]|nr:DUF1572 domain-containing protein [Eudoraea sp.]MBT8209404.1 DUF1572 domain-containing protein [Eudoraea sp.]MBT8223857.1 DUF1572 domain-containing protein [Eudoraea sp.]NNK31208.1 DUF1572 family protein [Flavobacteriaceae bacterium]